MPLTDIKNQRILKFREKLLGYPLQLIHVKGQTHTLADRLSQYPDKKNSCTDLEERYTPMIASRSLRCHKDGFTPDDPHIRKIARIGEEDEDYKYIINAIKEKLPISSIKKESELKQIQGQYSNLSVHKSEDGDIVIRDCQDVYIPKCYRKELTDELHATHLSDASMMQLTKGHCYWPSMRDDLRTKYKTCEECLVHANSKPAPHHEITRASLELLQPNKVTHADYMTCLLYTSPSPRDAHESRMPSSA